MSVFQTLYQKLNPAQKQAVDTIEGPVMVIAGPGTGKTQILTLRIANILQKTDTPASGILALTFTEAGVFAMRKRLVEMIGARGYQVGIFTFHSFCNDLIRRYPDAFPRIIGSQSITDVDTLEILQDIILSTELKRLKPFGNPYYYLHPIKRALSELKRENISPQEAEARVTEARRGYDQIDDLHHEKGAHKGKIKGKYQELEKQIEKNEELVKVFEQYELRLRERQLYDYEDMIVETVGALEREPDFLLSVQEEFLYVLADEHQDANNSQNRLLELLASFHEYPNLFLVGDAKQAIYRFQGASLENFLYFKDRFPQATLIQLEDNYRSRQRILDSSYSLIAKGVLSEHELKRPLKAHLDANEERVAVGAFSEPEFEYTYVARSIRDILDQGVPPEEVAVLYRNNTDVDALVPALERQGISYVIESDKNILADATIQNYITLLRAIAQFGNEEVLVPVLFSEVVGLEPLDVFKILRSRRTQKTSLYELISSEKRLKEAGVVEIDKVRALAQALAGWSTLSHNRGLLEVLDVVANESGFIGHLLSLSDSRERLEMFRAFVRNAEGLVEVHRSYGVPEFLTYLDLLETHNLSIKSSRPKTRTPSVRLMTAHKSKGLEFDFVFIVGAYDGHWGNKRSKQHFSLLLESGPGETESHDLLGDERRLFYVALTRARHGATITYATQSTAGRLQLPCQFIEEIDDEHVEHLDTEAFERTVEPQTLLQARQSPRLTTSDQNYLRESFIEQGLSVTALNNYLRSPWEYFFNNLLRIPRAPNKHMLYGDAIHGALRDLYERMREGESGELEYLRDRFRYHLAQKPLSEHDYGETLKKGEASLEAYFTARVNAVPSTILATEFSIVTQLRVNDSLVIPLRGILDRVEIREGNHVHVTDYKTGKPKSRNYIEGKTKSEGAGDYKRQLVFYKLLLSLYEDGKYTMETGAIDFIEPDQKGVSKEPEVFHIDDDEVETLRDDIIQVANEIYTLDFWGSECDEKACHSCHLVDSLVRSVN